MSFILKNLQPVGGSSRSGSPSLDGDGVVVPVPGDNAQAAWVYGSSDDLATIIAAGYFDEVRDIVNPFDNILIANDGSNKELSWAAFGLVPKSPSENNVTILAKKIDAS